MQFKPDEYLLLSRRGNVPSPIRAGRRGPPPRRVRPAAARPRGTLRLRSFLARRVEAARSLRGGLRATWTAFGPGGQDL